MKKEKAMNLKFSTEEVMNVMYLDSLIEYLQRKNVKSSADSEKINRLIEMQNKIREESIDKFLEE